MSETLYERMTRLQHELAEIKLFQANYIRRRAARHIQTATDLVMTRHQETLAETLDLLEACKAREQSDTEGTRADIQNVQGLCERILLEPKLPGSNAWEAQQDHLNELEAAILREVLPLLPDEVSSLIEQAVAHHQELERLD